MTDLENGKPTVQMGKVLQLLQHMSVKVSLELRPDEVSAFQLALTKAQARRASAAKGTTDA